MVNLFISYSHFDTEFVKRFVKDLRDANISFWCDWQEIPPWDMWDNDVHEALSSGDITHFVYVHSQEAAKSKNVQNEIAFAGNKGIKIIVFAIDDGERPLGVIKLTPLKAYQDYRNSLHVLLHWLSKETPTAPIEANRQAVPNRVQQPTADQITAAQDIEHKRVRVIAGPGTGKSFVIEERVRWLLERGWQASEIFVVSFTRAASTDLRRRIINYCTSKNQNGANAVHVSTLHSLALTALAKGTDFKLSDPDVLSKWELKYIFDEEFKSEYGEIFAKKDNKAIRERAKQIRHYFEALWSTGEPYSESYEVPEIAITDLEKEKFEQFHRIFSQTYLTVLPGELVAECVKRTDTGLLNPGAVLGVKHFIVDEYQDLNHADNRFVEAIADPESGTYTYILGDDDQSIYAFRFAHYQGIKNFKNAFDYVLTECFRCTPDILQMATNFIKVNSPASRIPKDITSYYRDIPSVIRGRKFVNEEQEAIYIANSCKKLVEAGIDPASICILVSHRSQAEHILAAFDKTQGVKADAPPDQIKLFLNTDWIHFAIGLVRVACDHDVTDYIAYRIVLNHKGISVATCSKIKNKVLEHNIKGYPRLFYYPVPNNTFSSVETKAITETAAILKNLNDWTKDDTLSIRARELSALIRANCDTANFDEEWGNLIAALPSEMSLTEFKDFINSENRAQASNVLKKTYERLQINIDENEFLSPRVQIMTMHGAKGLNAQVVFIPGLENDIIPGLAREERPGAVFEAARRLYVSITRASIACIMTYPTTRTVYGKERSRDGSNFIKHLGTQFTGGQDALSDADVEQIINISNAFSDAASKLSD